MPNGRRKAHGGKSTDFVGALSLAEVDLLGFSLGGYFFGRYRVISGQHMLRRVLRILTLSGHS
jgi:hypothetical protein